MTENLDLNAEALSLAEQVLSLGCRVVLIKCGIAGMVYKTADQERIEKAGLQLDTAAWANRTGTQPCFKAEFVRSGTGAGDTSIAAFLTGALMGKKPAACAALAAAEGACCVTAYDALSGLRPLSELETRIRAGWETM